MMTFKELRDKYRAWEELMMYGPLPPDQSEIELAHKTISEVRRLDDTHFVNDMVTIFEEEYPYETESVQEMRDHICDISVELFNKERYKLEIEIN